MFSIFAVLLVVGLVLWSQHNYRKETIRLRAFESQTISTTRVFVKASFSCVRIRCSSSYF